MRIRPNRYNNHIRESKSSENVETVLSSILNWTNFGHKVLRARRAARNLQWVGGAVFEVKNQNENGFHLESERFCVRN